MMPVASLKNPSRLRRRSGETLTAWKKRKRGKVPLPPKTPPAANVVPVRAIVVDTVALMRRAGQLSRLQARAADTYRVAWDIVNGSIGNVMDFDRIRGGTQPGAGHPKFVLDAAEVLSDADKLLAPMDVEMLAMVLGRGHTIEAFARRQFGGTARDCAYAGRRFRDALTALGNKWHGRK